MEEKDIEGCCYCVVCGAMIPEGRMICVNCEKKFLSNDESD